MSFIDFKAIKSSTTIEQVVKMLGLVMHEEKNQLRGVCPACKSTGDRELVVTPSKGAFYCHGASAGGDLISLVAHVKGIGVKDAAAFIQAGTVPAVQAVPVPTSTAGSVPTKGFDRAKYQASLDRTHESLKDIPPDLLERADIGVSSKGALKGIVVPLYDSKTGEFLMYAKVEGITLPGNVVKLVKTA